MTEWSFINALGCLTDLFLVLRVRVSCSSLQSLSTSKNSNKKMALFQGKEIQANSNVRTRKKRTAPCEAIYTVSDYVFFFLVVEFSYKCHGSCQPYILASMLSSHGSTLGYWIKHLYDCGAGSLRDVRALLWFVFMVHTTQPSSKNAFVHVRSALILVDWRSETVRSVLWHSSAYTFELNA